MFSQISTNKPNCTSTSQQPMETKGTSKINIICLAPTFSLVHKPRSAIHFKYDACNEIDISSFQVIKAKYTRHFNGLVCLSPHEKTNSKKKLMAIACVVMRRINANCGKTITFQCHVTNFVPAPSFLRFSILVASDAQALKENSKATTMSWR